MSYEIKSTRVDNETFWTIVEYTLNDNSIINIEIPIFMPKTKQEIINSIENRQITEQAKLDAKNLNLNLKPEIDELIV